MARRTESTPESLRWPIAFAKLEESQSLVQQKGWLNLLADLRALHQEISRRIVHEIRPGEEGQAEQNYQRGQIGMLERLLEFEEELREWKENLK